MIYSVVFLRSKGLRLRGSELMTPVVGELQLIDWVTTNALRRPIRALLLQQPYGVGQVKRTRATLADPELLSWEAGRQSFRGIEIEVIDGRTYEYEQVWRVTPAPLPGAS